MSENRWRPYLESYLAVREATGHSVRAERKLLGEFLDFADEKGGAGPIRAEWALDWACMLSPRRGISGQAGRLSVVRNLLTYLRWFGQAVHCHLVRSHSEFAIVADGFDRTSFHGFLAKRLLLRGGRLLKHIGVAAVVAAREISGCGFPAQVAVDALVIDVKLSGHVFRVFIRNIGHSFSFVLCRWNSIRAFRDTGLFSAC